MEIMRVVVTGTVGAGKSTFIRTISEIDVVDTDRRATDGTASLKAKTTVAMDFGRIRFGANMVLHLYGTPGQERFDFMWDILIRRAHAFILLVASHRPQDFWAARRILAFMRYRTQVPMLIALTHSDVPNAWAEEDIAIALGYPTPYDRPPIVRLNALDRSSVASAIVALIETYAQEQTKQLGSIGGKL